MFKISRYIISLISTLTLEIYLIQEYFITDKYNFLFPLNILLIFILIVSISYIIEIIARIFSYTFIKEDYNWDEIFKFIID